MGFETQNRHYNLEKQSNFEVAPMGFETLESNTFITSTGQF